MIEIKNPCSVCCAGSCFDVPMCGALVQGISCIGLKMQNGAWCVVRTIQSIITPVFLNTAFSPFPVRFPFSTFSTRWSHIRR